MRLASEQRDEVRLIVVRACRTDLTRYAAEHASFQSARDDEAQFRDLLCQGKEWEAVGLNSVPEVAGRPSAWSNVVEGGDWIRVIVDVPGMSPDDIEVSLENNILTVSGEKKEDEEGEDSPRWHLTERRYGRFSRSFTLPRDVEHDQIEAHLDNGVLELTVPKSETARPRRIQIRNGGKRKRILGGS